jgi:hypothetical protein
MFYKKLKKERATAELIYMHLVEEPFSARENSDVSRSV